jgi:hypothetical protein
VEIEVDTDGRHGSGHIEDAGDAAELTGELVHI